MKHLEGQQHAGTLSHASSSLPVLIIWRPEHLAEISTFIKVSWLKLTVSKTEAIISGNGKYLAELATAYPTVGSSALSDNQL